MTGGANFNEVFFTEVRVPDDHRLGDVNQGWTVALTTLMNERASIGAGGGGGGMGLASVTRLAELVRHFGLEDDPLVRQQLADVYINFQVAKFTNQRAMDKIKAGQLPGPEMSIAKLALTNNLWRTAKFVAEVLGPRIMADTGEWGTFAWSQLLLGIPGMRIAGGTDEVMRNIVGERVLGLPRTPASTRRPRSRTSSSTELTSKRASCGSGGRTSRDAGPRDVVHEHPAARWIAVGPMPARAILCRGHG